VIVIAQQGVLAEDLAMAAFGWSDGDLGQVGGYRHVILQGFRQWVVIV
jgi:hypothetical protein